MTDTPVVPTSDEAAEDVVPVRPREPTMFESARFKLTLFYLAFILLLSLSFSISIRWLAQREYEHSNYVQRGAFRGVIYRLYGLPSSQMGDEDVFGFQHAQEEAVRARLNEYVLALNATALVVGGFVSYWYAGRTLKPIEDAHEAQKRFASDASHELRTPLTVLRSENEVFLRQRDFSQEDARDLIQSNLEEVGRLERLATNLLELTQYESARLQLARFDVRQVVGEAVKQTERIHPDATISVKLGLSGVIGHRESLEQLIGIVLDNACKYGQGKPIKITGKSIDGSYEVYIRDHGTGIPPTDLPFIFDRLYRGDKARSNTIAGHGLGLALARQIARANGATITASNHAKGGAVFTIGLERARRSST
jgi:two-component system sensor histidine kinase CiaH